ncbi:hypothetical protein PTKIN_Ptkin02bG0068000 [Pterospermum kingtungense]
MDVEKEVPRLIEAVRKNGQVIQVEVIVPWKPMNCDVCHAFGHTSGSCPNKKSKPAVHVWKPKQKEKMIMESSDLG